MAHVYLFIVTYTCFILTFLFRNDIRKGKYSISLNEVYRKRSLCLDDKWFTLVSCQTTTKDKIIRIIQDICALWMPALLFFSHLRSNFSLQLLEPLKRRPCQWPPSLEVTSSRIRLLMRMSSSNDWGKWGQCWQCFFQYVFSISQMPSSSVHAAFLLSSWTVAVAGTFSSSVIHHF